MLESRVTMCAPSRRSPRHSANFSVMALLASLLINSNGEAIPPLDRNIVRTVTITPPRRP